MYNSIYIQMHMKRWPNTSSNKTCEVVFARIQVLMFNAFHLREIVICDESVKTGLLCNYQNSTIPSSIKKKW